MTIVLCGVWGIDLDYSLLWGMGNRSWTACLYKQTSFCFTIFICTYVIFIGDKELTDKEIHDRDVEWLVRSDGECYVSI